MDKFYISYFILTYNNKSTHSATGHTPVQARDKKNELNIHLKMELNKKSSRKYPHLEINDKVKIYRKRKTGEKQHSEFME